MKQRFLVVTLVLMLSGVSQVNGQAETGYPSGGQSTFPKYMPNVLPPSPDAFSFTRYGNLPIGLSTGTVQYSVPVYTVSAGSLTHPISINYASNGVKIDEMSTRVGLNWRLTAGGAITRSVRDLADGNPGVQPTFLTVPVQVDPNMPGVWDFYNYVRQAESASPPDFAPDEYSFSVAGYSGKFIKRANGEFKIYNANGVKIETHSTGFLLTLPNGDRYYYLEQETTRQYSYPLSEFLSTLPQPEITAWHLTKIVSPTRDSIVFNYQPIMISVDSAVHLFNGISQNFSWMTSDFYYINTTSNPIIVRGNIPNGHVGYACFEPAPPGVVTVLQRSENHVSSLQSITFPGGSVQFTYSSREDVYGEKKLDTIKVIRGKDNKVINKVALNYEYSYAPPGNYDTYLGPSINVTNDNPTLRKRLFLKNVDQLSGNPADTTRWRHSFEYDDKNALPPRLSFAQDRYGYFNGKINTYFFPNDTYMDRFMGNNRFGGDRSFSLAHSKKGILKKVTYPTGGFTQFEYESNKTQDDYAYTRVRDSVYAVIDTSTYAFQEFFSDTIVSGYNMILRIRCDWASVPISLTNGPGYIDLEDQYYLHVEIIDASTGNCITGPNCERIAFPGISYTDAKFGQTIPAGSYIIKVTASRKSLRGRVTLERYEDIPDRSETSGIAGVRVKSVSDYTQDGAIAGKRKFIYGNWGDSASSSGKGVILSPINNNELSMTRLVGSRIANIYMVQGVDEYYCGYNTIHSNSVLTNFTSDENTVIYTKVIELPVSGKNESVNNGGTEHEFYFEAKKYPIPVRFTWGDGYVWDPWPYVPPGAFYSNNDFITGRPKATRQFTYTTLHGTREILQEQLNYYSWAPQAVDTFTVSKHVRKQDVRVPAWPYFADFDIYRYWTYFGFLKQDSIVTHNYTQSGTMTSKQIFASYHTQNYLPSDVRMLNSQGEMQRVTRRYIPDTPGADPNFLVYNSMRNANMINYVREETVFNESTELVKQRAAYREDKGMYLPDSLFSRQASQTEYLEGVYQVYDSSGNLLQTTGRDGVVVSYIWGYNKMYPVAKIVGKTYADAIAQSTPDMAIIQNPASDASLQTELDAFRSLSNALVTTYIYDPLVGLKRETDPNGRSTYYEYDAFNRLSVVRDNERNVVRRICYSLKGQPSLCGYGTAAAWETISSVCQTSSGVNTGNLLVTEKDMNPASATYGQTRTSTIANAAACPDCDSSNCVGVDKKCVNGVCETGQKICTSSIRISQFVWLVTYHYKWSDNSVSASYQEYGFNCLGGPIEL